MNDETKIHKRLLIRVLVSPQIGLGHVTRCRGVADVLSAKGWSIVWILNQESSAYYHRLALPGSAIIVPDTLDFSSEAPIWAETLTRSSEKSIVLLDGYLFDSAYLRSIQNMRVSLVLFDDFMYSEAAGADLVINSSLLAKEADYEGWGVKKLLLGPRFAPVREEFLHQEKRPLRERNQFLVMFGGSDILDLTGQFISALKNLQWSHDIPVLLVTGAAYPNAEVVKHCLSNTKLPVTYRHNVENMAEVMGNSRVALSAAGSTLFELAVMGVPTISLIVADNQEQMAWEMRRRKWCVTFDARKGLNWQSVLDACISRWAEAPHEALTSVATGGWCDGLGLSRIAEAMEDLS